MPRARPPRTCTQGSGPVPHPGTAGKLTAMGVNRIRAAYVARYRTAGDAPPSAAAATRRRPPGQAGMADCPANPRARAPDTDQHGVARLPAQNTPIRTPTGLSECEPRSRPERSLQKQLGRLRRRCAGAARPLTRPPARRTRQLSGDREQTQPSPDQRDHDRRKPESNACGHMRMQVRRLRAFRLAISSTIRG